MKYCWKLTHNEYIFVMQFIHIIIRYPGTTGIGFPQFSFVDPAPTTAFVPNGSGQHLTEVDFCIEPSLKVF